MSGPLRLEYLNPRSLTANPANWRHHPDDQRRTAAALLSEVGWADTALFNLKTQRLIDGHMRVQIAAERGDEKIPVLVGEWTEEQEAKILASLDSLGMMASADAQALGKLLEGITFESEDVTALMDSVKAAADLIPPDRGPVNDDDSSAEEPSTTPAAPEREQVPDALWPSDNPWDVPSLDLGLAGNAVDYPVTTWGSIGHGRAMGGTYHFYTADRRFDPLWSNPSKVLLSGCPSVVEPNFSTSEQTPFTVALWAIFRKRWLGRYWQSKGLRVFVDINVHHSLLEPHSALQGARPNFLGVPKGWPAYATRSHGNDPRLLDFEHDAAAAHSGLDSLPLFLVVGGGEAIKRHCGERGWVWVPDPLNPRTKTDGA